MKQNEGPLDRIIRAILALAFILVSFALSGPIKYVLLLLGLILGITAITGFCLLYTLFGINTKKKD